jgi:hypothetical protein
MKTASMETACPQAVGRKALPHPNGTMACRLHVMISFVEQTESA